jgi:indole-3-glycerol phosphate synthase
MKATILSQILERKRDAIARLQAESSSRDFYQRALEIRQNTEPHRLLEALKSDSPALKIIAEFKRRSPSAGTLRDHSTVSEIIRSYDRGGACAISVLTDEQYFGGSITDLCAARSITKLPLLCKDFIIDPIQIFEAAIAGADAVLLVVAALEGTSLKQLHSLAEKKLGLDALVEVHNRGELKGALHAGAKIIGVNNRDLGTFHVSLSTSQRLISQAPRDRILISESGLQGADSLIRLRKLGFHGFLVGQTLMCADNPEIALRELVTAGETRNPVSASTGDWQR